MLSPASTPSATEVSLRKKRERDRRAQRTFRTKRNSALQSLQTELSIYKDRVARYEHQISELEQRVDWLCQQRVSQAVGVGMVTAFVHPWRSTTVISEPQNIRRQEAPLSAEGIDWRAVPRGPRVKTPFEYQWLSNPSWAAAAPDIPNALELLYGSKHNRLADAIHHRLAMRACREPERLAYGWLMYLLAKWILQPTDARFSQVPSFMKPTREQIQHEHSGCIDGLIWPGLRANLVLRHHCYDMEELTGFIACCIKVRWPWGVNFMAPTDDGAFVVKKEFYDMFMSVKGWGLTSEFMRAYPELMEGLDLESVHYEVV